MKFRHSLGEGCFFIFLFRLTVW